ncbi:MAG: hypothetical protein K2H61_10100 [Muribaculaceae bacterium]|nr:hypothetical protein [Muribaculaceae bacterium]
MNQTNYLKIVSIALFLVFGAISCWATAESLHLLLASWPKIFCYLVAIGFFIVASIGTKLIVDSLNQKIYVESRTAKLIGGILLVLVFWLFASMPTNTHTFIYRNVINERVNNDIATTQSYLTDIIQNKSEKERVAKLIRDRKDKVNDIHERLNAEIRQPNNPGNGPQTDLILTELTDLNPNYRIHPIAFQGSSLQQQQKAIAYYNEQFEAIDRRIEKDYYDQIKSPNKSDLKKATDAIKNLDILRANIEEGEIDLNSAEDMEKIVVNQINNGYQAVNLNKDFVSFRTDEDEQRYSSTPIITETKRMTSIFDVWGDFMAGKFGGHGFVWWIMLAILVDLAAFIFFDLAFKKRDE